MINIIFCNNQNRFILQNSNFINEYKVGLAFLELIKINNYIIPYGISSVDKSPQIVYKKIFSEYNERTRVGYNTFSKNKKNIYNTINENNVVLDSCYIGYGYNDIYGVLDTTGTSSGLNSETLIRKSLYELLEKNELLLFWYRNLGKAVQNTEYVQNIIKKIGFISENIYIFFSSNISNANCFIVIICENEKVVSCGISMDMNINDSLTNALLEAKLFEKIYMKNKSSPYEKIPLDDSVNNYKYINYLYASLEKIIINDDFIFKNECEDLKLADWINDISFSVLNNNKYQKSLTVRCLSKDLLGCLPLKYNISKMKGKKILEVYNIFEWLDKAPECYFY